MDKKGLLTTISKKAEASQFVPSGKSIIQSVVSSIPFVGSALDHLIFDKADEIRLKNIERTLDDIKNKVSLVNEAKISKEWFESTECMQMFKLLIEKTQFEPNENKITNLAKIFIKSGLKEFEKDPNKFAVLTKAAEMTLVQQRLLQVFNNIPPTQRSTTGGSIQYTATAIWISQIVDSLNNSLNRGTQFWNGRLQIDTELDILETFSLIRSLAYPMDEKGYNLTALGKLLIQYLSDN